MAYVVASGRSEGEEGRNGEAGEEYTEGTEGERGAYASRPAAASPNASLRPWP